MKKNFQLILMLIVFLGLSMLVISQGIPQDVDDDDKKAHACLSNCIKNGVVVAFGAECTIGGEGCVQNNCPDGSVNS
jgi:hypothetical protein